MISKISPSTHPKRSWLNNLGHTRKKFKQSTQNEIKQPNLRSSNNDFEKKSKRPFQKELIKKSWAHPKEVQATKIEKKFKQPSRDETQATNSKGSPSAHPKRSWLKHLGHTRKKFKQPKSKISSSNKVEKKPKQPMRTEVQVPIPKGVDQKILGRTERSPSNRGCPPGLLGLIFELVAWTSVGCAQDVLINSSWDGYLDLFSNWLLGLLVLVAWTYFRFWLLEFLSGVPKML